MGLLVSAAGLWFAFRGVRWGELSRALSLLTRPYLLLSIPLAGLGEYLLRTERWRLLLGAPRGDRRSLFPVVAGSFFLNNVLPFRAGEAARVYWTHRDTGRPLGAVVGALALDRAADVFALTLLMFLLLATAPQTGFWSGRSALFLFGAVALGVGFFAVFGGNFFSWVERGSCPDWIRRFLAGFSSAWEAVRRPRTLGKTVLLSAGIWGLNVALDRTIGGLFGLNLTWGESAWFLVALAAGVALPSSPGYVGTFEAAGVGALALMGRARADALPFVLILHAGQILSSAVWGLPGLWRRGRPRDGELSANLIKSAP